MLVWYMIVFHSRILSVTNICIILYYPEDALLLNIHISNIYSNASLNDYVNTEET